MKLNMRTLLYTSLFVGFCLCEKAPVVQTKTYNVVGNEVKVDGKSYGVFLSIPYAKPPIGKLRFQPPQPFEFKNGATIETTRNFSKACIQPDMTEDDQSEDCLYLNVMTPTLAVTRFGTGATPIFKGSKSSKLPVMVWIYGGAFVTGATNQYPVEGTLRNLVSRGIVFVSLNYRVGPFGFFTTKSQVAPGNYALLDQNEALKWVKANIEYFGGDPTKITIMGESAGGASVSFQTISPLSKNLFSQAIMQSGSSLRKGDTGLMYDDDPKNPSDILLDKLDCKKSTYRLENTSCPYGKFTNNVTDEKILQLHQAQLQCMQSKSASDIMKTLMYWGPRVDGNFLPDLPINLMKKRSPLKFMMGVTRDEYATFSFLDNSVITTAEEFYTNPSFTDDFVTCKDFQYPTLVNATVRNFYGHSVIPPQYAPNPATVWFQRDVNMRSGMVVWSAVFTDIVEAINTKSTVYVYSWDWQDAGEGYDPVKDFYYKGAPHASELSYQFDYPSPFRVNKSKSERDGSQDKKATETLGKLLTNFVKFGDPTPDPSTLDLIWHSFQIDKANYLSINFPNSHMDENFYKNAVDTWNVFVPNFETTVNNSLPQICR